MDRSRRRHARSRGTWTYTPRLASMVLMLVVLWMLIMRSRDPGMWTWLAPGQDDPAARGAAAVPRAEVGEDEAVDAPLLEPPVDPDIKRQLAGILDRTELSAEEMPAYWSLLKRSQEQSFEDMDRKARAKGRDKVTFAQIWQTPEKFRGGIIKLRKLHVRRVMSHEALEDNVAGAERIYEAWGWTEDSQSYPWLVVFSDLPEGMPTGDEVFEDVTFVGYFHKLMAYGTHDERRRAAPLLIGRVTWKERPANAGRANPDANRKDFWMTMVVGGVLLVLMAVTWSRLFVRRSRPVATGPAGTTPTDDENAGRWLADASREGPDPPADERRRW